LLAGLVLDPQSRAVEVLERAGVAARELAVRIDGDGAVGAVRDAEEERRTSGR
ncbi:peptidase, partial [Streptomyces sp. NPDC059627]